MEIQRLGLQHSPSSAVLITPLYLALKKKLNSNTWLVLCITLWTFGMWSRRWLNNTSWVLSISYETQPFWNMNKVHLKGRNRKADHFEAWTLMSCVWQKLTPCSRYIPPCLQEWLLLRKSLCIPTHLPGEHLYYEVLENELRSQCQV